MTTTCGSGEWGELHETNLTIDDKEDLIKGARRIEEFLSTSVTKQYSAFASSKVDLGKETQTIVKTKLVSKQNTNIANDNIILSSSHNSKKRITYCQVNYRNSFLYFYNY